MKLKDYFLLLLFTFAVFIAKGQSASGGGSEDPGWDDGYKGYLGGEVNYDCLGGNMYRFFGKAYFSCNNPIVNVKDVILRFQEAYFTVVDLDNDLIVQRVGITLDDNAEQIYNRTIPLPCYLEVNELLCYWFKFGQSSNDVFLPPNEKGYLVGIQLPRQSSTNIQKISNARKNFAYYYTYIPPVSGASCMNSSARFSENPPAYLCVNVPFSYNLNATDPDGDSLSYGFCNLKYLISNPETDQVALENTQYKEGLKADHFMWAESKPQIDPVTGTFYLTPIEAGIYTAGICVYEWRDGRIINTTIREIDLVVLDCTKEKVANIPAPADAPNTFAIVCDGFTVKFQNKSQHSSKYLWKFGFGNQTSTAFEPTVTYPDTGTYEVTLYVDLGEECADSITRLVKIYPEYHADFEINGRICLDSMITFTDATVSTAQPVNFWSWSINKVNDNQLVNEHYFQKNVSTTIIQPGNWFITLNSKNAKGCSGTITKEIRIEDNAFGLFNDTIVNRNNEIVLQPSGAVSLSWKPASFFDDAQSINPKMKFENNGVYQFYVNGITAQGCGIVDSFRVSVIDENLVFMPTAFSPNNDGLNDVLQPVLVGMSRLRSYKVFDRYGQLVYYSLKGGSSDGWDGSYRNQPASIGVYFWVIELVDADGNDKVEKGNVTLLR